jgi:hypothetical protein
MVQADSTLIPADSNLRTTERSSVPGFRITLQGLHRIMLSTSDLRVAGLT